jgi:hypothetical protein
LEVENQTIIIAKVFGRLGPTSLLLQVSAWRDRYAASKGDIEINIDTNILVCRIEMDLLI